MLYNQPGASVQGPAFLRKDCADYIKEFPSGDLPEYHIIFKNSAVTLRDKNTVAILKYLVHETYLYFQELLGYTFSCYLYAGTMTDGGHGPGGGIPLHEFRRDVPPGWAPGIQDYPLRLYFERLKLWYRVFEGDDTLVGPLVAG